MVAGEPHDAKVARLRVASILAGGATGTLARAGLAAGLPDAGGSWPWATFAVNLAGAALLAWLTTRLDEIVPPSRFARLFLATGLCGGLTTFSTFQIEVLRLAKDGHPGTAVGYAAASLAAGMAVAVAATVVARRRRYG